MKDFLAPYIKNISGDVLDLENGKIGEHDGATFFTIGQKYQDNLFVISKNLLNNTITVGPKDSGDTIGKKIDLIKLNTFEKLDENKKYTLNVRYHGENHPATVANITENSLTVIFEDLPERVAMGQSAVLYDGQICVGGGIIDKQYE